MRLLRFLVLFSLAAMAITGCVSDEYANDADEAAPLPPDDSIVSLAAVREFRVDDYVNPADGAYADANALRSAIAAAKATNLPAIVRFSARTYSLDMATPGALTYGNAYTFDELMLANTHDIQLAGAGVAKTRVNLMNPRVGFLYISSTSDIALRDMTIDYARAPFTQGVVTQVRSTGGSRCNSTATSSSTTPRTTRCGVAAQRAARTARPGMHCSRAMETS